MKKAILLLLTLTITLGVQAQSVEEIVDNYIENIGGYDAWSELKGMKLSAKVNQQGLEIPLEIVQLSDGRQLTKFTFQGNEFYQNVFDGETLWSINFQSLKAEKAEAEATANQILDSNDFPDSWFDYKKKGYSAELLGQETIEGTETFKVKLTKEPKTIDGQEVEDVTFYYFDTEYFVPIVAESEIKQGPQKGSIMQTMLSDYQEVQGLMIPFSIAQGIKGGPSQPLTIESVQLNPEVDDSAFAFPE